MAMLILLAVGLVGSLVYLSTPLWPCLWNVPVSKPDGIGGGRLTLNIWKLPFVAGLIFTPLFAAMFLRVLHNKPL